MGGGEGNRGRPERSPIAAVGNGGDAGAGGGDAGAGGGRVELGPGGVDAAGGGSGGGGGGSGAETGGGGAEGGEGEHVEDAGRHDGFDVYRMTLPKIPQHFTGTGDLAAALLLAWTQRSEGGKNVHVLSAASETIAMSMSLMLIVRSCSTSCRSSLPYRYGSSKKSSCRRLVNEC